MFNGSQWTPVCVFVRFPGFELQMDARPVLMARRERAGERKKGKGERRKHGSNKNVKVDLNLNRFIHFGEGSHVCSCLPPIASIPCHPSQLRVSPVGCVGIFFMFFY